MFFTMAQKDDKLFVEYELTIKTEKKELNDHASVNHGGGGEDPPPYPSTSDNSSISSSLHSNRHHRNASKNQFFKLEVKFDFPRDNGECNVKKLNNWIRYIE